MKEPSHAKRKSAFGFALASLAGRYAESKRRLQVINTARTPAAWKSKATSMGVSTTGKVKGYDCGGE